MGTKAVEQQSEITANAAIVIFFFKFAVQKYKGAALKTEAHVAPNLQPDRAKRIIKDSLAINVKVQIYDAPIASTIKVYAAWVSLSRPTTVRTTPSLKPTLNLPSWLPPKNTEHRHIPKLILALAQCSHSNTHTEQKKQACTRSPPHTQSHKAMDG